MVPLKKHLINTITLIPLLVFVGCQTTYKEVLVPTKCNVKPIEKPKYSNVIIEDLKNILVYDELLQEQIKFCTE